MEVTVGVDGRAGLPEIAGDPLALERQVCFARTTLNDAARCAAVKPLPDPANDSILDGPAAGADRARRQQQGRAK
jgi:hypothetical protein